VISSATGLSLRAGFIGRQMKFRLLSRSFSRNLYYCNLRSHLILPGRSIEADRSSLSQLIHLLNLSASAVNDALPRGRCSHNSLLSSAACSNFRRVSPTGLPVRGPAPARQSLRRHLSRRKRRGSERRCRNRIRIDAPSAIARFLETRQSPRGHFNPLEVEPIFLDLSFVSQVNRGWRGALVRASIDIAASVVLCVLAAWFGPPCLDSAKLAFIDETGCATNMTRLRGRDAEQSPSSTMAVVRPIG
jgi:hypothetical protein